MAIWAGVILIWIQNVLDLCEVCNDQVLIQNFNAISTMYRIIFEQNLQISTCNVYIK